MFVGYYLIYLTLLLRPLEWVTISLQCLPVCRADLLFFIPFSCVLKVTEVVDFFQTKINVTQKCDCKMVAGKKYEWLVEFKYSPATEAGGRKN